MSLFKKSESISPAQVLDALRQIQDPDLHQDIVSLGFLPVQEKYDAYAAALALCQPSLNESFSIVIMEAWAAGTPVLVHEGCVATRDHCVASRGGLYFASFSDFVGCLDFLLDHPEQARRLAWNGCRYVELNYAWDRVIAKYLRAFRTWGFDL